MSGEVRHLAGASPAAGGPVLPPRERGARRGRGSRAFEQELAGRADGELIAPRPPPAQSAHPRAPLAGDEAGGRLDVVA